MSTSEEKKEQLSKSAFSLIENLQESYDITVFKAMDNLEKSLIKGIEKSIDNSSKESTAKTSRERVLIPLLLEKIKYLEKDIISKNKKIRKISSYLENLYNASSEMTYDFIQVAIAYKIFDENLITYFQDLVLISKVDIKSIEKQKTTHKKLQHLVDILDSRE